MTQVNAAGAVVGSNATIIGGSDQCSQGNELDQKTYERTDNFTIPRGQTTTDPRTAVNIVQFNTNLRRYSVGNFASNYWRTQISLRYSF